MSKKIFLVLILSFQIIKSQQIYFPVYHYESENGLIHLNVLSIQQSNGNVLYFITQGGVYEYTGKEFRKNQVYSQLKNIRNLLFTDSTTLLIHRDNGLYKIINKKHIQPLFEKNPFKKPCDKILLNDIFFINYTDQISVESYDLKNNRYYNDSILLKDNSNQAFCVLKIKNQILIGRRKGLYIFDNGKQKLITHFSGTPIYSLFYDESKHRLYLGSKDRIIIADDSLFKIQHQISIKNLLPSQSGQFIFSFEKNISKLIVDKFDRIWFSVQPDDNLYLYENNTIYDALSTLNILPTLLNDLFLDKFNNIWIATFNDGVYQIASTHWKSFKINFNQKNFNVRNIETSDKYVYFSTSNGLYYSELNNLNQIKAIIEPDNFFNNDYTTLFKFENIIYTSCVINFDFKKIKNNQDIVFVFPFKYLSAINSSKCYVSDVTNNVLLYDISKQKIIDTIFKPDDYRISVHHLLYYNNKLFISTSKGLYVYNNNKDKTIYLSGKEVQKVEITEQQVYILSEDKIYNYPQLQIVFNGEAYQVITIKDVLKWHQNYFIASEEGLVLVDNQWKAVYHYGRKNGLISNVINDIYAIDSTLILATDKGVSFTQMKNLFTHYPEITTPSLQFIVTNNDTIYWKNQKQLSFNTLTHDIYFYILCSNFNPLTKVKYQYKLNESEWINFDNSPLHFSSLSGGNYVLQIRATTDEKHFTEPLIIKFSKEYKWTERKWFWEFIVVTSIILVSAIVLIIRKIEKRKSYEKQKTLQQMMLLKHQALNAILSPHFIFNSLTGIQNYILNNETEKASDYLSKFSRLIRMIIEKASLPTISLQDEIKRLQYYLELEKERFEDKFDYEIKMSEKINLEQTFIPNMIIQPYLENAILHGILQKKEKGYLLLKFDLLKNNFLEIIIEDDGIGIIKGEERKSKHHKSLATQTIAEILNINTQLYQKHQSVEIIDKSTIDPNSTGTIVKILIQL